LDEVKTKS